MSTNRRQPQHYGMLARKRLKPPTDNPESFDGTVSVPPAIYSIKQVLLEGLDDIGMTLKHEPDICAYEKSHSMKVMYEPVDFKHFTAPN